VNRATFRLILTMGILGWGAAGFVKMASRRWSQESSGPMGVIGDAVQVAL
jgi:hypothetical protein